jgi:L-ascorbate metabolism protein UlaG (beta-lactamase superfamily)
VIKPALQDEAFLADVREPLTSRDEFRLWWLGQSGYLLKWRQTHVLIDPYLSDALTVKYGSTDKPHVRMSERVVDPCRLDFIDVVTSSHNHTDHLDAETLRPLVAVNPHIKVVVALANREFAAVRSGVAVEHLVGVSHESKAVIGPLEIFGVPAAHEQLERDEKGRDKYLGYVFKFGNHVVYHSGDTVMHQKLVEQVAFHFPISVALLPINGRAPERRVAGNLWGREAGWLAKTVGAKMVIPCHYDMFEFNTATPDEFVAECERLGQPYRVLKLGERWSSAELDR